MFLPERMTWGEVSILLRRTRVACRGRPIVIGTGLVPGGASDYVFNRDFLVTQVPLAYKVHALATARADRR